MGIDLNKKMMKNVYTDLLIKYAKEADSIVIVESDLMNSLGTNAFK